MNQVVVLAQEPIVISAGRRKPVHGGFTATSMLLRPAEITIGSCAFNLGAILQSHIHR